MMRTGNSLVLAGLALLVLPAAAASGADNPAFSLGTGFTYRGVLIQGDEPAHGLFDLSFRLYDAPAAGTLVGEFDLFDVKVGSGTFEVDLDFGVAIGASGAEWLEVDVRTAATGAYVTLEPRERIAGKGTSPCTVAGDVEILGQLAAERAEIRGFFSSLDIEAPRVQARAFGVAGPLTINAEGGRVGIGVATPQAPLHLPGAPDANPSSGGALVIGSADGLNLALDNNEILARNNGDAARLTLNNEGGDVRIGGTLDIGYQVVQSSGGCNDSGGITVSCPAGSRVVGGGCSSGYSQEEIEESRPNGDNGWHCRFDSCPVVFGNWKAHAICLRVK